MKTKTMFVKAGPLFDWETTETAKPIPAPANPIRTGRLFNQTPESVAYDDDKPWLDSDLTPEDYDPGHCWYYLLGGRELEPEEIAATADLSHFEKKLPKSPKRQIEILCEKLAAARESLAEDTQRYLDIRTRRADALSRYDTEIAHGGCVDMAVAVALSLKHNHICYEKGRVAFFEAELASRTTPKGPTP